MTKWTPGPWVVERNRIAELRNGYAAEIATAVTLDRTEAERDANARLISAAPELYEALLPLVHRTKCGNAVFLALTEANAERALAALAKASPSQEER